MSSPLLKVTALEKSFRSGKEVLPVLKGIDLTIEAGETVALVGASGAGKSTLLHILGTLDYPTSGQVCYNGTPVFDLPDRQMACFRNKTIGFVFQFHHLLPEFTALENVLMPAMIAGKSRAEAHDTASKLLSDVGLARRLTHKPGELSGGEQQRVAVARALVLDPCFIMADEPTGNLDMKTSEEVHELLMGLQRDRNISLLVVTHNELLADRMGRKIRLLDGMVVPE